MTVEIPHSTTDAPSSDATSTSTIPEGPVLVRVYIVRHGETDANREGIIQGHLDTSLNAAGIEQARLAADALEDVPFSVAWSSDLQRARKTAEIILENHPEVELQTTEALRERFMGDWQGGHAALRTSPPANLEPLADMLTRASKWWAEGVQRHVQRRASQLEHARKLSSLSQGTDADPTPTLMPEPTPTQDEPEPTHILAVSHGGLIGGLVTHLIGGRRVRAGPGVVVGRCFNASISVVELYAGGRGVLVSYADTTHLSEGGELVLENADVR